MIIYPNEEHMTLNEIMVHRDINNLSDISFNDVQRDYEAKIEYKSSNITNMNVIEVTLDYLQDGHIPEYSLDGCVYLKMGSSTVDVYTGDLGKDFEQTKHNVYIRVRNEITDTIDFEYVREPNI